MTKKFSKSPIPYLLAALTLLASCALLFACNKTNANPLATSTCYELTADYEGDTLEVYQEILYYAPADTDGIVFHIYANAFNKTNDVIDISSAQINRKNVEFDIYGKDKTLLKLHYPTRKGKSVNISFQYTVTLPKTDTRLGITARGVSNLACFYPVVARYENGYREDCYNSFGDPFYHDISSFYVNVTLDEGLDVACSGEITDTRLVRVNGKDKKTLEIEAEYVRDFAMSVGKMSKVTGKAEIDGNEIGLTYCYIEDPYPARTLERISQSLSVFSEAFGAYPYKTFTVAQSNLSDAGGMEYGTFVTVSLTSSREEYLDTVTHETAHQWWYNLVGNDQINSAWLDEGLTEFCTYYFHYLTDNREKFKTEMNNISKSYAAFAAHKPTLGFDGSMNRPLSSYLTDGEYVAVCYFKGALLFNTLRELVGDGKFQASMQRYLADNRYGIATEASLIAAFKSQGCDVSGIVTSFINDTAVI